MIELIKKRFELHVRRKWLKIINEEVDAYKKALRKADRHKYVLNELLKRYNEIYGENLESERNGND
jgi:hypothetical protein